MRVSKKRLCRLACLFAAVVCWAVSLYAGEQIRDKGLSFGLIWQEQSLLPETLDALNRSEESSGIRAALWSSVENSEVQAYGSGRKAETKAVYVYGDMSLVLHSSIKSGAPVLSFDEEGCILDEKSAYDLFGSSQAVGNKLLYEGEIYVVRGILRGSAGVFYYPCPDRDKAYSNMEIRFPFGDSRAEDILSFLQQNHFGTPMAFSDIAFLGEIMGIFCHLPAWISFGVFLRAFLREVKKLRGKPMLFFCGVSAFLLLLLFSMLLTEFRFSIPQRFVPTKWSDFSFWSAKLNVLMVHAGDFMSAASTLKNTELKAGMALCIGASVLSCIFFGKHWRKEEKEALSAAVLFPLGMTVFVWLALAYRGRFFTATCYYYLTSPVLAVSYYILRKWQAFKNQRREASREEGKDGLY